MPTAYRPRPALRNARIRRSAASPPIAGQFCGAFRTMRFEMTLRRAGRLAILIRPMLRDGIARLQVEVDVLPPVRPEPLHLVGRHLPPRDVRIVDVGDL